MTFERVDIGLDCTIYRGDCREVLPTLGKVEDGCVVTDPHYGIGQDRGMGGGGVDGFGNKVKRNPRVYEGDWDQERPCLEDFKLILAAAERHIIWGGNYFSDLLPPATKWLFWDKQQTMPSYSDGEIAWTSLPGTSTKKFTYNGSGLMAKEKVREHPTQKPVELMLWCLRLVSPLPAVVIDPYLGSGTTGVAAMRCGCKFIGIEREQKYFDIARRRIEAEVAQRKLFV